MEGGNMDWHTILVGAIGFVSGMATTVLLAAFAAAGQADRRIGQHSTQHTQNTHTDTHSR